MSLFLCAVCCTRYAHEQFCCWDPQKKSFTGDFKTDSEIQDEINQREVNNCLINDRFKNFYEK